MRNGKGSVQRRRQIPLPEYDRRWSLAFRRCQLCGKGDELVDCVVGGRKLYAHVDCAREIDSVQAERRDGAPGAMNVRPSW